MRPLLSRLLSLLKSDSSKSPARHRRRLSFRPRVEALEDRAVPTAVAVPSNIVSWWTANSTAADCTAAGCNFGTPELQRADRPALPQKRDRKDRAEAELTSVGAGVRKCLDLRLYVFHMDRLPLEYRASSHGAADHRDQSYGGNRSVVGDNAQVLPVQEQESRVVGLTQAH